MLRTLSIVSTGQDGADLANPSQLAVAIRDYLLALPVKGGERVFEAQMARELGVGRPLVREACRILEDEGLLTYTLHRGYALRVLTREEVRRLLEFRLILEEAAFVSATTSEKREAIVEMVRGAYDHIESVSNSGDPAQQISADLAFHRIVIAEMGNPWLLQSFDRMSTQLRYAIRLMGRSLREFKIYGPSHEKLVSCLEEGNPERTRAEIRRHINMFLPGLLDRLQP